MEPLHVTGIGWVLPQGVGSGAAFLDLARAWQWHPGDNAALAGFSAKEYLGSVKGYLDPAGAFCLAAAALAQGGPRQHDGGAALRPRSGICTVTRYGSTLSAYRFTEQFLQKGPRFASPLIFPHGYANTPGNLAAIEFGCGGPHLVLYGDQDVREAMEFAHSRLADGTAADLLLAAYESAELPAVPDGLTLAHGAVALLVQARPDRPVLAELDMGRVRALGVPGSADGMTAALIRLLATLTA